jgi:hypothetical protein
MREYGYGLHLNVALYWSVSYEGSMRDSDGVAEGVRQHTSADVAPELYEPAEESRHR